MKNIQKLCVLVAVLFAVFVQYTSVSAQTPEPPTPTPSSTWEPLYKTPTPAPTMNTECPIGPPEGWGTITPNPNWLYSCRACIPTNTPVPTTPAPCYCATPSTINPVPNATVCPCYAAVMTGTPLPTNTPTITPTPGPRYYIGTVWNVTLSGSSTAAYQLLDSENLNAGCPNSTNTLLAVAVRFIWSNSTSGLGAGVDSAFGGSNKRLGGAEWYPTNNVFYAGIYPIGTSTRTTAFNQAAAWADTELSLPGPYWNGATYVYWPGSAASPAGYFANGANALNLYSGSSGTRTYRVDINTYSICYGVPPSPTPVPPVSSDCLHVNDNGGNYNPDDPLNIGLDLPNPLIEPRDPEKCFAIPSGSLDLSWINAIGKAVNFAVPASVGVPEINICPRAIKFGTLNIVGMTFDLDWMIFFVGVVFLVRSIMG